MKIISGGKKQESAYKPTTFGQEIAGQIARPASRVSELLEGGLGSLGAAGLGLANRGIEAITGKENVLPHRVPRINEETLINDAINKIAKGNAPKEEKYYPTMEDIKQRNTKVAQGLGLKKEQLNPQNIAEELVDWTAQDLPIIFATGGGALLNSLGRSAASGVGALGAKKLGFGGIGQFIGSLVGGNYFDAAKKAGSSFGPIRKIAKHTKEKLYKEVEILAPKINLPATQFKTNIDSLLEQASGPSSGLTGSQQNEVVNQLDKVYDLIRGSSVNAKEAWNQKKHLYSVIPQVNKKSADYLRRAAGYLEHDVLQKAAQSHPEFGKAYNTANQLHIALDVPNKIRAAVEKNGFLRESLKSPIAKGLLGLGGLHAGLGKAALTAGGGAATALGARTVGRVYDFYKTPIGRQIWSEIAQESLTNNIPALANSFVKLNTAAEEWERENPEGKTFKVISGGRKKKV